MKKSSYEIDVDAESDSTEPAAMSLSVLSEQLVAEAERVVPNARHLCRACYERSRRSQRS